MAELRLTRKQLARVSMALEDIAEAVGEQIAVSIVLHDIDSPWFHYHVTDGPPDAFRIEWAVPDASGDPQ